MVSVVVATPDVVGERMAGPGIRAWHFTVELKKHFDTTLISRSEWGTPPARKAMREASVLIGQPARGFRRMRKGQRIVYDLFDPVLLELREMYGRRPSLRQRLHFLAEQMRLQRALAEGDLFIVATPNQRELYAGKRMIEVPFGAEVPEHVGVEREDLIVWGGGTWEWLDPRTAVDAVVRANQEGVSCRMLFLGRSRPNPALADRRREDRFEQLVADGQPYVSANTEWVPYRERFSWLRRGKIAIMLHRSTAEARYSIRTRLFDAIGAATPVIATEEGYAAEVVEKEGLGVVVPPGNVDAVTAAIKKLLQDDAFHAACVSNLERIRPRYGWSKVVAPLVDAVKQWQS